MEYLLLQTSFCMAFKYFTQEEQEDFTVEENEHFCRRTLPITWEMDLLASAGYLALPWSLLHRKHVCFSMFCRVCESICGLFQLISLG